MSVYLCHLCLCLFVPVLDLSLLACLPMSSHLSPTALIQASLIRASYTHTHTHRERERKPSGTGVSEVQINCPNGACLNMTLSLLIHLCSFSLDKSMPLSLFSRSDPPSLPLPRSQNQTKISELRHSLCMSLHLSQATVSKRERER